jgi:hypothetical protein
MTDEAGMMSADFMVGFTIFIVSFIWVATMIPGLFIGLQSHSIDFDAVAYRTGVILAEDPGAADTAVVGNQPWEIQKDKRDVVRFGLAVSKDSPRILDENKVNRFFCTTMFSYPADYQKRAIFGDYPYRFNISIREAGLDTIRSVGDTIPDNYSYGYIRRDVKIKSSSNTTIGQRIIKEFKYNNTENVTLNKFSVVINSSRLLNEQVGEIGNQNGDAAYRIFPKRDRIILNLTNLDVTRNTIVHPSPPIHVNLSEVKFYHTVFNDPTLYSDGVQAAFENYTFVSGSAEGKKPPVEIKDGNLSMIFEPGFFSATDDSGAIFINMTFELDPPQQYLNNTHTKPFDYNYIPANVTQPALRDAVMEVAVW